MGDRATGQVSSIRYGGMRGGKYAIGEGLKYDYDQSGNITHIRENGAIVMRYAYDKLNRIIREDNKKLQETTLFTYDNNGNILSKRTAAFNLSISTEHMTEFIDEQLYAYDGAHPDRLVEFDELTIEYNPFGNPTQYLGNELVWQNGRKLKKFGGVEFAYDGFGKRIKKGNTVYTYDIGGKLLKQSDGTNTLEFVYDGNGGLVGVKHNSTTQYIFRKNIQGDITHTYTLDGTLKACYTYDAWGNHEVRNATGELLFNSLTGELNDSYHIGNLNPFRYRSYYYDTETNLYFLKTRYYNPVVGRFISQDEVSFIFPEVVNGLNLYAYCINNPIMLSDHFGTSWTFNATSPFDPPKTPGVPPWKQKDPFEDQQWEQGGSDRNSKPKSQWDSWNGWQKTTAVLGYGLQGIGLVVMAAAAFTGPAAPVVLVIGALIHAVGGFFRVLGGHGFWSD